MREGVMTGCSAAREWMLPWWFENYQKHHTLPVVFADLGMTQAAKEWCRARGVLLSLDQEKKRLLGIQQEKETHDLLGQLLALMKTPFQKTIWLDLDCEVVGALTPMFHKMHSRALFSLMKERDPLSGEFIYNTGVIVYDQSSRILEMWLERALSFHHSKERGKEILGTLIQEEAVEFTELPSKYNWDMHLGIHPEAVILHWRGDWGKRVIWNSIKRWNLGKQSCLKF
ncbi:hypothetical protein [Rhabdochlamydiaceae symbiont of Dictyostelium giganteum]|uniref:hypothetical protein n=1 Tax=Rhabdochlamydiaceae symbiont of Dictyostelium giganteum TaxID=3342349 RepID=UPI00384E131B